MTASALSGVLSYTGGARTAAMLRNLKPSAKLGGSALLRLRRRFHLEQLPG